MPMGSTRTFPLDGPINLSVRIGHGSIVVRAEDDVDAARVEITARAGAEHFADQISVALEKHTLAVHAPRQGGIFDLLGGGGRQHAVDVTVRVPSGTALDITTFTADVAVHGRCGGADLATATGRHDLGIVSGDLRVRAGTSTVCVEAVHGSVVVRNGSGDVRFGEIDGDLKYTCGTGRLEVTTVGGAVRTRSGSGEAVLGAVHGDVDLASGSGPMSIGLPPGFAARLDVVTGSGRIDSELPIEDHPDPAARTITIRAKTGGGDVRLFRAA